MTNDLLRWKQNRDALDRIVSELYTLAQGEDSQNMKNWIKEQAKHLDSAAMAYDDKIKSRETLKAQLEASLSQATDGGKE